MFVLFFFTILIYLYIYDFLYNLHAQKLHDINNTYGFPYMTIKFAYVLRYICRGYQYASDAPIDQQVAGISWFSADWQRLVTSR